MTPTGVLLAAGTGRRFGSDKRRILLPNHEPLLLHCVRRMRAVLDDVLVVLRPEDTDLRAAVIALDCRVCVNPQPDRGMGSSLACAVQASRESAAWLVQPADLPLVRLRTLRRIAEQLKTCAAVVPICHGRRGHPVGFSVQFADGLARLSGEPGARSLLKKAAGVVWLNLHDPGIYLDVDRPADVETVCRHLPTQEAND